MTDLATLALRIDSSEVKTGVDELNKLTAAGTKTEAAVDKMGEAAADTAAKTKTASQAAAEMAREAQAAAAGGSAYAKAWVAADTAITKLAQAQAEATHEINRAKAAYNAGEASLAEYNAELLRTKAALSLVEAEHQQAIGALRRHATAQSAANDHIGGFSKVSDGAAFAARNLNYQLVDMAQGLAMGAPPLMVMMQQLPQAADAFSMLARESGGTGSAIAALAAKFGPFVAAAVAAFAGAAGALKIFTDDINENSKVTVTWGDVALGTYDAVKSYLLTELGPSFHAVAEIAGKAWEWIAEASKKAANFMIGTFVAVPKIIVAAWDVFPGAIAEIVVNAANAGIKAIEEFINKAIAGMNKFIAMVNATVGSSIKTIGNVDLPEIENKFAGAGAKGGAALAKALVGSYRDYVGDFEKFVSPFVQARAVNRLSEDGKKAGRTAGKAAGAEMAKTAAEEFVDNLLAEIMANNAKMMEAFRKGLGAEIVAKAKAEWDEFAKKLETANNAAAQAASDAAEANRAFNDELRHTIDLLDQVGGAASGMGDVLSALYGIRTGDFSGLRGPAGALFGSIFTTQDQDGKRILNELGQEFRGALDSVFGGNGKFFQALQGLSTGAAIGQIVGNGSTGSQIGGMVGGAAGQAIGATLGSAGGPIGAVVGAIAGSLLGGLLKQSKSKANVITNGDISGAYGGTGGDYTRGADALSKAVLDNLDRLADALGATATGAFKVSIGMRDGNYVYNPTGSGTKSSMGAINVGKDSEAAIKGAIQDAISDGVFEGLSAGVERLLKGEGDLETQLQKALSFQGVFDELEKMKDPQGFDLKQLDKWRKGMDELFAEAGATSDELAQLEELTGLKRKEIVERYSEEMVNAEEILRANRQVEIEIMQLEGKAQEALNAARLLEQEGLDASTIALLNRRNALQDEIAASQELQMLADRERALWLRLHEVLGDTANIKIVERAAELNAALTETERMFLKQIYAAEDAAEAMQRVAEQQAEMARLQNFIAEAQAQAVDKAQQRVDDARSVLTEAYDRESGAIQDTIDRFRAFGASLRDFKAELLGAQPSGFQSYARAQGAFVDTASAARMGDPTALAGLQGAGSSFLEQSLKQARTLEEYQRDVMRVVKALDEAALTSDTKVSDAELQLDRMDAQYEQLVEVNQNLVSFKEAVADLKKAQEESNRVLNKIAAYSRDTRDLTNSVTTGGQAMQTVTT